MANETILSEAKQSLERIQLFDCSLLARTSDLGRELNFDKATQPARDIVDLYKRVPLSILEDLTEQQLQTIRDQARADYALFDEILNFSAAQADAAGRRNTLISQVQQRRDPLFQAIWQFIAYGIARITDTNLLETQARATLQTIKDEARQVTDQLDANKEAADKALDAIRAVAAEQGVSQQAIYFKDEAEEQESLAETWLEKTYWSAGAVGIFALISLFLHKWEWIRPATTAEMFQLVSSKVLIFAVLGYLLILAARNYTTHKHNSVVNRHRQNALLTYRSLVGAATERGTEDIVLAYAASCIFAPQETGFAQGKGDSSAPSKSVLELVTKSANKIHE